MLRYIFILVFCVLMAGCYTYPATLAESGKMLNKAHISTQVSYSKVFLPMLEKLAAAYPDDKDVLNALTEARYFETALKIEGEAIRNIASALEKAAKEE